MLVPEPSEKPVTSVDVAVQFRVAFGSEATKFIAVVWFAQIVVGPL